MLAARATFGDSRGSLNTRRTLFPLIAVVVLTPLLAWAAFPPSHLPEAALLLAVPGLWWAARRPAWKLFLIGQWAAWTLTWVLLLFWLHHVTWAGLFLLAAFLGLISTTWFAAARAIAPTLPQSREIEDAPGHLKPLGLPALGPGGVTGLASMLGLAALWVLIEWVRTWLFTGFPWLTLAASQWQRPLMLGLAPITGAWGVSFVIILVNLGLASHLERLRLPREKRRGRFSLEMAVALVVLLACSFGLGRDFLGQKREPWARVGIVQPYIPQEQKWDEAVARDVVRILESETAKVAALEPDFLLWPEAATPWVLTERGDLRNWLGRIARDSRVPLLAGVVALDRTGDDEQWFNSAVVIDPENGVQPERYVKRHLVPFGEFVPIRPVFGWLEKFVPIGGDFVRGTSVAPLTVSTSKGPREAGVLICYEDVFPNLARTATRAGAEVLVNVTNNAWYGEGAAAYQHAAHSVLRAAENRRPVVRSGNGGWSGWIDEYGSIRATLKDEHGSVYFRGGETVAVTRDARWIGRETFYTRHGDWFVVVSGAIALATFAPRLRKRAASK
jgi:apolipoprotein N-acyltransferase